MSFVHLSFESGIPCFANQWKKEHVYPNIKHHSKISEIRILRSLIRDFWSDHQPYGLDFRSRLESPDFFGIQIVFQKTHRLNERKPKEFKEERTTDPRGKRRKTRGVGGETGSEERNQKRGKKIIKIIIRIAWTWTLEIIRRGGKKEVGGNWKTCQNWKRLR